MRTKDGYRERAESKEGLCVCDAICALAANHKVKRIRRMNVRNTIEYQGNGPWLTTNHRREDTTHAHAYKRKHWKIKWGDQSEV